MSSSNLLQRIVLPYGMGTVTPMNTQEVVELIISRRADADPFILGNLNLHAAYILQTDEVFQSYCSQADATLIDGWPILKLAERSMGKKLDSSLRIGSSDWLMALLESNPVLTIVAVGGTPSSSHAAGMKANALSPNVSWHGFDGFGQLRQYGDEAVALNDALGKADLVLVGLGMPRQEKWILDNLPAVGHAVVANVGGCLDYLSGEQAHAPRWLGKYGLEWLYRLARSPRRLAGRYLVEPVKLAAVLVKNRSLRPSS